MTPKPTPYRMTPDEKRIVRWLREWEGVSKEVAGDIKRLKGWRTLQEDCQARLCSTLARFIERGWHRPTPGRTT